MDGKDQLRLADFEERQRLKDLEDRLIDILLIFDVTCDTITSLLDRYRNFHIGCDRKYHDDDKTEPDFIVCALQERRKDVLASRIKVKALHKKIQGTTNLVSNFILQSKVGCILRQMS